MHGPCEHISRRFSSPYRALAKLLSNVSRRTIEVEHMTVSKIRHTGIVVSDIETSLPFYRDLLGLQSWWDEIEEGPFVDAVTGVPGARIHTVKLKAPDGVSIELLQYL